MGGYDDIGSNWTAPQTESGVPGPVYDEIYKEIESGNYRQAQSKLEAAINRYGNDDHFAELSEMLHAVGGITRNNTAGAFVENCSVSMTTDGCTFVGGVAEYQSGTVSDCTAALQINGVTCLGGHFVCQCRKDPELYGERNRAYRPYQWLPGGVGWGKPENWDDLRLNGNGKK